MAILIGKPRAKVVGKPRPKLVGKPAPARCAGGPQKVANTHADPSLVLPSGEKTGCLWCPLLPMCADFSTFADCYEKDAEKILAQMKFPHTIHRRKVSEPWDEVDVLLVGEGPGDTEDKKGLPFVGEAGQVLMRSIALIGSDNPQFGAVRVGKTNVVRCRPPGNRDPAKAEIHACLPELLREIKARKPKVLVALGAIAMKAMTATPSGVTALSGRHLPCTLPGLTAIPLVVCVHPSYVMRADHELEKMLDGLTEAFKTAIGTEEKMLGLGVYRTITDANEAVSLLHRFIAQRKTVAVDTETGSLSPFQTKYPQLLCFSFSDEAGVGYVIPFDHKESLWSADKAAADPKARADRAKVVAALREFFTSAQVDRVMQNTVFDMKHIRKAIGVVPAYPTRDTMTTHVLIDDRRATHGLGVLAPVFTGMGTYFVEFERYKDDHNECNPEKGGSYANIDGGKMLFPYAGQDADATFRVDQAVRATAEYRDNPRFDVLSRTYFPAVAETLAEIEYNGMKVDGDIMRALEVRYRKRKEQALSGILKLPQVRAFIADKVHEAQAQSKRGKAAEFEFNPGSDRQVGTVLWGYYKLAPKTLTDGGLKAMTERYKVEVRKQGFDPQADPERASQVFNETVKAALAKKEFGFFSTAADVLYIYDAEGNPFAPLVLEYRECAVMLGTFLEPAVEYSVGEGIIRSSYHQTGAVTGRLSSSDPNLQNQPLVARMGFVSRFGNDGGIMEADQSQIELRLAACVYRDPQMIEAYRSGADVHTQTAVTLAGVTAEEYAALLSDVKKQWRVRAKRFNFGIIYGVSPQGIQGMLRKDGVMITLDEAEDLMRRFVKGKPVLMAQIERAQETVRKLGYADTFMGQRRRVPEVASADKRIVARALRQAINAPIQGGAASLTLLAMVIILREMRKRNLRSLMVGQVHDSIVFDVLKSELPVLAKIVKDAMERVDRLSAEIVPGTDWSWLQVPLVAELSFGKSWGTAVGFDPFAIEAARVKVPSDWAFGAAVGGKDAKGVLRLRDPRTYAELFHAAELKHDYAVQSM